MLAVPEMELFLATPTRLISNETNARKSETADKDYQTRAAIKKNSEKQTARARVGVRVGSELELGFIVER